MLFCINLPNIIYFGPPIAEIWRHINFSRWQPRPLNTTSGFVFVDVAACLQKAKIYQQAKFRPYISIHGWDITTSGLEKQTSAIFEFYFRFPFRPCHRSRHLHQSAKFHPHWTAHRRKMTSCRLSWWRILNFRGPIMGYLKYLCLTSYMSSIETIALKCLVFEKIAFYCTHFGDRHTNGQTYGQTDGQPQRIKPPSPYQRWVSPTCHCSAQLYV